MKKLLKTWLSTFAGTSLLLTAGVSHATTIVDVTVPDWEWTMTIQPEAGGPAQEAVAQGEVVMRFDGGTFDIGSENAQNPIPVGAPTTIDVEILSMSLSGNSPVLGGDFGIIALGGGGQVVATNIGGGEISVDSFFDVFFDIVVDVGGPNEMVLNATSPLPLGMAGQIVPEIDVLWPPFFVWQQITVNTPELVDQFGVPWDTVIDVHTTIPGMQWNVPEPTTTALLALGLLGIGYSQRRRAH